MKNKYGIIALILIGFQLLLFLGSWLVTASFPEVSVRSLLSGEGFRWFEGEFVANLKTDFLIWMLLFFTTAGVFKSSGLYTLISSLLHHRHPLQHLRYRERVAIRTVLVEFILYIACFILLTCLPQPVLLSVTGSFFPSALTEGLVPSICFIFAVTSVSYGAACGIFKNLQDIYNAFANGFGLFGKFFPFYLIIVELVKSVAFIFDLF